MPLIRRVVARVLPVAVATVAAVAIGRWNGTPPVRSFGLFYGVQAQELVAMVALPVLAWTLLAPTAALAYRVGLPLLAPVAGWACLVHWSPSDRTTLYRLYPFVQSGLVVLVAVVTYTRRRPAHPFWTAFRRTLGVCALLLCLPLSAVWTEYPRAVAPARSSSCVPTCQAPAHSPHAVPDTRPATRTATIATVPMTRSRPSTRLRPCSCFRRGPARN